MSKTDYLPGSSIELNSKNFQRLIVRLRSILVNEWQESPVEPAQARQQIERRVIDLLSRLEHPLKLEDQRTVTEAVIHELIGFGPLEPYLADTTISEIMVNGSQLLFIERDGQLIEAATRFDDDTHLMRIINRMIHPLGLLLDSDHPTVDARLPDGSRINAVIPPVSIDGPTLTIRKFLPNRMTITDLYSLDAITPEMVAFLEACVAARLNILITGGTSSGKTTLLNLLSSFIPPDERIITIEDAVELQLRQRHVVRLETRPANMDGRGMVSTRDLVRNALRMRPDRIIVGEVRSGEALDMLQAMNTGHSGSITTLHANTPRDAISRLETMTLMAGLELPLLAIRKQIAAAINLIVHQARLPDGTRKTTRITEVAGMESDIVTLSDIFTFDQSGLDPDGRIIGQLRPTGLRPLFTPRLEVVGYRLGADVYGAGPKR